MFLEGHQVVEGIDIPQVAGVNQAHEHITDEGAMLGLVEKGVFPVEDGLFQDLLTEVMPTAGLCRVDVSDRRGVRGIPDFQYMVGRHNQRLSRKVSKGSEGK